MMKYDKIKEQVKEVIKYSQELPVENLNIDKLFVHDQSRDQSMISHVISG